jgi:hypothetical protein
MNTTNQQVFSESEDYRPSFFSTDNLHDNNILNTVSPSEQSFPSNDADYIVQSCSSSQQDVIRPVHPTEFFFRPPNDCYHYRVNCEEISYDIIESLLKKLFNDKENDMQITQFREDEYIFIYQQRCNNRFYKVSCEIVSPLLINYCLSKAFFGIELQQQYMGLEHLAFTFDQEEYLEYHLKQYLSQYLLN